MSDCIKYHLPSGNILFEIYGAIDDENGEYIYGYEYGIQDIAYDNVIYLTETEFKALKSLIKGE